MADRTYDQPGNTDRYSLTVVQKYSKGIGSTPRGKSVSWQRRAAEGELADLVVTLSMSENFEGDVNTYYPADNSTSYTICNMLPDSHYYYKVEEVLKDGTRNVVTYGHFITTGQVRMMRVGGMSNVRDFGGWNTSFGVKTNYGRIFRGNHPRGITETGRNDFVKNERIKADLELTGTVRDRSAMGPANEVEIHTTNNARYKTGLTQPSSKAALRDDLKFISRVMQEGKAVFLHCNHGVNRAGTLAFVIGGLIGLSEADLSREYELSSFAYGNTIRAGNYASMLPVIRSYGKSGDSLTQCFYNYCLELGVSEEELDGIRCAMLGLEPEHELIEAAHRENNDSDE
ncbi:MAG: tyrosine-protein phosphatase [Muribaculaceae bacterium]|nr:tyrosine-protein phosphatase [Muribaculaceae bacterium]